MPFSDLGLLLYDKGVYDQYRAGSTDQDFMDWQNNGRKYAANRGVLTNNLEYGEALNPQYGKIMDVIAGRQVLKGNPPTINAMDYERRYNGSGEESGLMQCPDGYEADLSGSRPRCKRKTSTTSQYTSNMNYPSIAESMLTATGAPSARVLPTNPVVLPQPVVGKPALPRPTPSVPVATAPITPNVPTGGGGGGGGTGGGGEPKPAETEKADATPAPEGFFKKNWMSLLGVVVGGIGGYMYAANTGKSVPMFAIGGAAVGGGAGFGIQYMMDKKKTTPAPATSAKTGESGCCGA
jgi:hypothetical protein